MPLVPRGQHVLEHLSVGHTWAFYQAPNPEFEEQLPRETGSQMSSSSNVTAFSVAGRLPEKEWGQSPKTPHSSERMVFRDPVASPLLWRRHWPCPCVRLRASAKGQALPTLGEGSVH